MNPDPLPFDVVTVTLNPAIDRTVEIPHFTAGIVNRVESVRSNPGGKGVNVAVALAEYGQGVAATGFLGRDNTGAFEALFAEKGVADHFIRIPGQTRVGIKITDAELHQTTDINFPGPAPGPSNLELLSAQLAALDAPCFVLAGSLPPGVDPTIYRQLIRVLKARGARVFLDTSGAPLLPALEAAPHLIKPNLHELEALLGRSLTSEAAVIAAAREIIARGVEMVVVSMGRDGACFVCANEVVVARPPEVAVRSTVGAGDAMVAGLVAAHLRALPLAECARLATAFSVRVLSRQGPEADFPAAVQALSQQVQIH